MRAHKKPPTSSELQKIEDALPEQVNLRRITDALETEATFSYPLGKVRNPYAVLPHRLSKLATEVTSTTPPATSKQVHVVDDRPQRVIDAEREADLLLSIGEITEAERERRVAAAWEPPKPVSKEVINRAREALKNAAT